MSEELDRIRNFSHTEFNAYKRAVGEAEWQAEQAESHKKQAQSIKAAKKVMLQAQVPEGDQALDVLPSVNELEAKEEKELEKYAQRHGLAQNASGSAAAHSNASNTHLRENKDAYHQISIEDANAAGHSIDFGGEHYPAQQPEEPKEPQHQ